mmetsp:Transcript_2806/g.11465  ORF Transcript_2806/g.11465 Transcript_2806/m.11465 type:complete len:207 (-) Transcript_2806:41-661(-)
MVTRRRSLRARETKLGELSEKEGKTFDLWRRKAEAPTFRLIKKACHPVNLALSPSQEIQPPWRTQSSSSKRSSMGGWLLCSKCQSWDRTRRRRHPTIRTEHTTRLPQRPIRQRHPQRHLHLRQLRSGPSTRTRMATATTTTTPRGSRSGRSHRAFEMGNGNRTNPRLTNPAPSPQILDELQSAPSLTTMNNSCRGPFIDAPGGLLC